jgi:hypothetical protein
VDRVIVHGQPDIIADNARSIAAGEFQSEDSQIKLLSRSDANVRERLIVKALNGDAYDVEPGFDLL